VANPSLAKPTNPRYDSAGNATLVAYVPLNEGVGLPAEIVSLETTPNYAPILGAALEGYGQGGPGALPAWATLSFGDLTDTPVLRCRWGTRGLRFAGRSFTSTSGSWTIAAVFRPMAPARDRQFMTLYGQTSIQSSYNILASTSSNNSGCAIALNINEQGTIRLAELTGSTFAIANSGSPWTLTAGHVYAVAMTFTNTSAGRIVSLYDYTTQTLVADSVAYTSAGTVGFFTNRELSLAPGFSGVGTPTFLGDIACALLDSTTWASGTNTKFADFYADPSVWARGTGYTSTSGAMVTGALFTGRQSATEIDLSCTRPQGGTWPVAVQLHRGTTPGFTPDSGTALAGKTGSFTSVNSKPITWTDDTDPPTDAELFYKAVFTDSAGSPLVVTSADTQAATSRGSARLGFIGASIATAAPAAMVSYLNRTGLRAVVIGQTTTLNMSGNGVISIKPGTFSLRYLGATASSAGSFTLNPWGTGATASLTYNDSPANIQLALNNLAIPDVTFSCSNTAPGTGTNETQITVTGSGVPAPWGDKQIVVTPTGFTAGTTLTCHSPYANAVHIFTNQGVTDILLCHGLNESATGTAYRTLLATLVDDLVASGFNVYMVTDYYFNTMDSNNVRTDHTNVRLLDARNQAAALDNGTTRIDLGSPASRWVSGNQASLSAAALPLASNDVWAVLAEKWHRRTDPTFYGVPGETVYVNRGGYRPSRSRR